MTVLIFSYAMAASPGDPDGSHPLFAAVQWIEGVALGTLATSIALIAVASVGFMMLTGRMPIRRAVTVIAGCFILFGAPYIAQGFLGAVGWGHVEQTATLVPTPPAPAPVVPQATPSPAYDPYAGAAVPRR